MSIYVPRVESYVTENDVKFYFENWEIGKVSHVDFVQRLDQEYKQMYVHFSNWFNTPKTQNLQRELNMDNNSVKFKYVSFSDEFEEDDCTNEEYDFSWYFLKNKSKKSEKKVIDLEDIYDTKESISSISVSSNDTTNDETNNTTTETSLDISFDYVSNDYYIALTKLNSELKKKMYLLYWGNYDPYCLYMDPSYLVQYNLLSNELITTDFVTNLENENMSMQLFFRNLPR
jgi:hypothetical protein